MVTCMFCGQAVLGAETVAEATENCYCNGAENARKIKKAVIEAKDCVNELFGEPCKDRGMIPLSAAIIEALYSVCDLYLGENITTFTATIAGICTIKISRSGNSIKVSRAEGRKYEAVAGEK